MLIIGLTGGIGSGKSAVSHIFTQLGVPVIDSDIIAREVVEPGRPALQQIIEHFGAHILTGNGELDRDALRQRVFTHPEEKRILEQILHPVIEAEMVARAHRLQADYCVFAIPLLIEAGQQRLVDRILVVDAPDELRRGRIKQRSRLSDGEINAIFAAQLNREERLGYADDILDNSGTLAQLESQVTELHIRYKEIAGNKPGSMC